MLLSNNHENFNSFILRDATSLMVVASSLAFVYFATTVIYNIYFHPLRHFPGPKLYAASRLPYAIDLLRGTLVKRITELHNKYGEVIRIAPEELSFTSADTAWQDVYGFRGSKKPEMQKDRKWYSTAPNGVTSIIESNREDHSRQRRAYSHAFSDRALREQEPLIQKYISLLLQRLTDHAAQGNIVDLVQYYNYTTFDIIGDLAFNEPFGCLENDKYHDLVQGVFATLRGFALKTALAYYDVLRLLVYTLNPSGAQKGPIEFFKFTKDRVRKRLGTETARPDITSYVSDQVESGNISVDELDSNALLLLIAGSETTATVLSGTTYLLLKHPEVMKKVVREVRDHFKSKEEITSESVSRLTYLVAVLNEGMRMYPPVPTGFPRIVPEGGSTVSGYYVPEKTSLYVTQWATYHSERNFTKPESFIPERWLENHSGFEKDRKAAFSPFSFGPRACLGKNLAYMESRVILAQVLFNFDIELIDENMDWMDQRCFVLWEKPDLRVKLKPVEAH
ncbi:Cytochrome p450 protein [Lasiodiplodia theobromae]|uniref:Cytochrome p450 protein n=1 Tax=Lasiodiplodia theobromae TaxID=45133 RepID=UPI0015C3ACEC|nr:Cytochrome p450 protein [Lasiodiplodia theobromae]KAF4543390.1 Cytochrome p450 protein [Lasiodiplodia theobromae]